MFRAARMTRSYCAPDLLDVITMIAEDDRRGRRQQAEQPPARRSRPRTAAPVAGSPRAKRAAPRIASEKTIVAPTPATNAATTVSQQRLRVDDRREHRRLIRPATGAASAEPPGEGDHDQPDPDDATIRTGPTAPGKSLVTP